MMRIRSFTRFWVIIAAACLIVGVILAAWSISRQSTRLEVQANYNEQQRLQMDGTAGVIESFWNDLAADLVSLSSLSSIQNLDEPTARAALTTKFNEITIFGIAELGVVDSEGRTRFFTTKRELEGVDYSWRTFYKEARAVTAEVDRDHLIIEPQLTGTREPGFSVAIPIFAPAEDPAAPDEFRGVILGTLRLNALVERYIVPNKPPGDGVIFLVNHDFDVVWSSDDAMLTWNLQTHQRALFREMRGQVSQWEGGETFSGAYAYDPGGRGQNVDLVAFAPLQAGSDWMAVAVITPGEVAEQTSLAAYRGQQNVFIISVVTLLVGVLVGGFVLNLETRRRFQAEELLRRSEREQAVLAERNRLAGDLHDSVTQSLYGIVLHADAARGQLAAENSEIVAEYLDEIGAAGKEGLAEMRMLIFKLRPPVLESEGLVAALETRLYAVERRVGLKTSLVSNLDGRLPPDVEEGLYRIAQESLNNALKHAEASHIQLIIHKTNQQVAMLIADNGCGFDTPEAAAGGGLGLKNMAERAQKLDAQFTVKSQPGNGTKISVEVNL